MADSSTSTPPPDGAAAMPARPGAPQLVLALDSARGRRARRSHEDRMVLGAGAVTLEHGRLLHAPLEIALGRVAAAVTDPGPAQAGDGHGRFPVLRRLGPRTVIPRSEGIEGWLWTRVGGTALTNLGEEDEAPNAALLFSTPLGETELLAAFDAEFVTALAAGSPLGIPAVRGVLFRVGDAGAAQHAFERWGFQTLLTDREVPPALRRHLPTDRSADPRVHLGDDARAATSVPPPGMR